MRRSSFAALVGGWATVLAGPVRGEDKPSVPVVAVEGQPLGANVSRLLKALDYLGAPLPADVSKGLQKAAEDRDARKLQQLLDQHVLFVVSINPEERVKVARGPAKATLQQGGFTLALVKVLNDSTVTKQLRIGSPQAGPVYSGEALLSMQRQQQMQLKTKPGYKEGKGRFLEVEMF